MKYHKLTLSFCCIFIMLTAQSEAQNAGQIVWKSRTIGRVYATPILYNATIYFGSTHGTMKAVNGQTGADIFSYETGFTIKSAITPYHKQILFVGGHNLYSIDAKTGAENWIFDAQGDPNKLHQDDWDYHNSGVNIHKGIAYFGSGSGNVYAINPNDGTLIHTYPTNTGAAVRSTPRVYNGVLYFGDWDGWIYAVDLTSHEYKWTYQTFTIRPYPTFGGITSEIIVHQGKVFFGARNTTLFALDEQSGMVEWTFTENTGTGGWISGNPVLKGNRLYIGGSDNHRFFCINIKTGREIWHFDFDGNCFSTPLIINDKILLTSGDGYANESGNNGQGFIYVLDTNGKKLNHRPIDGNVFSSPKLCFDKICFGSDDGHVYAIKSLVQLETVVKDNKPKEKFANRPTS